MSLYAPECSDFVEMREVAGFIRSLLPSVDVTVKKPFLSGLGEDELLDAARWLASSRVKNIDRPFAPSEPMFGEVEYERRGLAGEAQLGGIVYDGRHFEELLISLLEDRDLSKEAHVVFTDRLISTYSSDDLRHHLRTVLLGFPSIISVPGLVEAPARPREYYLLKQRLEASGGAIDPEVLKESFRGRFLDYGSPETTEVSKGMALQAIVYHLTLGPFCGKKNCRLFNAHWQEDLLRSQSRSPGLCTAHSRLVKRLGSNPVLTW